MERYKAQETDKGQRGKTQLYENRGMIIQGSTVRKNSAPYKWGVLLKGTSMAGKLG